MIRLMRFGPSDPPLVRGFVLWAVVRGRPWWTRFRAYVLPKTGERWIDFGAAGVDRSIRALVWTKADDLAGDGRR